MATQDRSGAPRRRRTEKPQPRFSVPEVVYTQPKPFNRHRLMLRLLTVVAVVIAFGMGLSIFFKVENVTVTGAEKYSAWSVSEASGLEQGDSLLFFGRSGAASRIIHQLPYVKTVRFRVDLPGTVNIIIEESPMAYCVEDTAGAWWHITSEGRVVEQAEAVDATQLLGLRIVSPVPGELAVAEESESGAASGADRLSAALEVCRCLEENEILGQAASVDVSSLQNIQMWYAEQYQIKLGDLDRMDYKVMAACQAVRQMSSYQKGILDASFTTFPDKVGYMPFTE